MEGRNEGRVRGGVRHFETKNDEQKRYKIRRYVVFFSLSPSLFSFYPGEVNLFRAARPDRNHLRGGGIDTHGR